MQDVSRGVERTRIWPKKRGKNLPEKTKEQMELFRQIQWAAKFMDARVYQTLATAVKNSPIMPRDFWMMLYSGRAYAFQNPDGSRIYSMAVLKDVSESLDVLGATEGFMLIRGPDFWEGKSIAEIFGQPAITARAYLANNTPHNNGGWQNVPIDTVDQDPLGWFDASVAGFRPTVPGYYNVNGYAFVDAQAIWGAAMWKNNADQRNVGLNSATRFNAIGGQCQFYLDGVTDYVQFRQYLATFGNWFGGIGLSYFEITGPF